MTSPMPDAQDAGRDTPQAADEGGNDALEALRAELEQLRADSLRERADLDNQRKRMARELESARRFANERLLADLLPLFDSMEAGLAAASDTDPLREGLELTLRQLHRIAEANGLAEIAPAPGEGFDPERHQAMSMAPDGSVASGSVSRVFQKRYVLYESLLRPALGVVAE